MLRWNSSGGTTSTNCPHLDSAFSEDMSNDDDWHGNENASFVKDLVRFRLFPEDLLFFMGWFVAFSSNDTFLV